MGLLLLLHHHQLGPLGLLVQTLLPLQQPRPQPLDHRRVPDDLGRVEGLVLLWPGQSRQHWNIGQQYNKTINDKYNKTGEKVKKNRAGSTGSLEQRTIQQENKRKRTKNRAGSTGIEVIDKTVSNIHTTEQETETKVIKCHKFRQTHGLVQ